MIFPVKIARVQWLSGWTARNFFSIFLLQKLLVNAMLITCGELCLEMIPIVEKALLHISGSIQLHPAALCFSKIYQLRHLCLI